MDPVTRGNQPVYSGHGRPTRRGSIGSGSAHRGDDHASNAGVGGGYQGSLRPANGDNHHNELLKTIYVSNITASMPDDALWEAFAQFGRLESLVRRDVNVDMNNNTEQQYAFIRYRNRQDARYAITAGEINFYGRKLVIRPRDKPAYLKQNYNMNERGHNYEGFEKARSRSFQGPDRRFEQRGSLIDTSAGYSVTTGQLHSAPNSPLAEMLSKVLTVANLPSDMSPKELFDLFAAYGSVERSYIYQQADALGRRFGEVTMTSFYFAQKAYEGLNSFSIRGIPLDVSYKVHPQSMTGVSSDPMGVPRNYTWAIAPQMQWPYPIYGGNGAAIHGAPNGSQFNHPNHGIVLPYAVWNAPNNPALQTSYGYPGAPIQGIQPSAHIPVCVYPQQVTGAQLHKLHSTANANLQKNNRAHVNGEQSNVQLAADPGSRCVSGASSATLVANGNDSLLEKKYQSPLIVTSPTYPDYAVLKASPVSKSSENLKLAQAEPQSQNMPECPQFQEQLPVASPPQYEAVLPATTAPVFDPTKPAFVPETSKPRDPSNLYIKNLDDMCIATTVDLKAAFGHFGQIASAFLATYPNGTSKGFGFVAFVNPSDAVAAKEQLDGAILGRKRVFVTFAERREERTQRLKELFESKKDNSKDIPASNLVQEEKPSNSDKSDICMAAVGDAEEDTLHAPEGVEPTSQSEGEVTVTTTVTTTKAWKGTQLQGIVEVEEEESPCTKKYRQQRTQSFVQQSQIGGAYKDSRPMPFASAQTPPSSTKSVPTHNSTGARAEGSTGSPVPVQQRHRQGIQPQRRPQSPRNGTRPFYPPGRGDSGSPKPLARQSNPSSTVLGAPTGPRIQANNNGNSRNGGASARDTNQKKKKTGRRHSETGSFSGYEYQNKHQMEDRNLSSPGIRDGRAVYTDRENGADIARADAQLAIDSLEIHSAP